MIMADFTIYGIPQSSYVRSVRMACVEKDVPYTIEPLPPSRMAERKLQPFGRVPAVRHGDFALYETSAILHYIDDAFPGGSLKPAEPRGRARMEQWISTINGYCYDAMIRGLVLQYVFPSGADGKPNRAIIDKAASEVQQQVDLIDEALAEGPFLCGAAVSLADLLLAPIMAYVAQTPEGGAMMKAARNIPRAGAAMQARKSYQETVPPAPERH
jgi:glutathione S-transferase